MIQKRDKYFIGVAKQVASASKCVRAQFGTVIVSRDGRIVSTAYNGKPRGATCDNICFREGLPPNANYVGGVRRPSCCLHSESNALLFSSPWEREGGTMYVTGKPCEDCSLLIQQSGVSRLVYLVVGDGTHPGWVGEDVFKQYGSKIEVVPYREEEWNLLYDDERREKLAKIAELSKLHEYPFVSQPE